MIQATVILEPDRSVVPDNYHKTKEYIFSKERDVLDDKSINEIVQECIDDCRVAISGMCGVTIRIPNMRDSDFFVTVDDKGLMQPWNTDQKRRPSES